MQAVRPWLRVRWAWRGVLASFARPSGRVQLLRTALIASGMSLVGAVSALAVLLLVLSTTAPSWFRPADPTDPAVQETARRVHQAVANLLHRPRALADGGHSDPWAIALPAEEANAWLIAELPRWLENEGVPTSWMDDLGEPAIGFDGDSIRIGVRASGGRVVSATLAPRVDEMGRLWAPASTVHVGRVPVPGRWIVGRARQDVSAALAVDVMLDESAREDQVASPLPLSVLLMPETTRMLDVLAGDRPLAESPVVRLLDGRRVRLLRLRARNERLELICRTER
ncbi:MAG: hypothetical protein AAGG07_07350 [Planctomycetota bacterium]